MDHADTPLLGAAAAGAGDPAGAASLMRAALAVSSAGGEDIFCALTAELAAILRADATFIAVFNDNDPAIMRTLACVLDGRQLKPFEYQLRGTPCEDVTGRDFKCLESGTMTRFPPGSLFAAKGMDGYAGYPLTGSAGQPLGLIVAMTRQPLDDAALFESMLKIFAARVSGEIERAKAEELVRRAALAVSGLGGGDVYGDLVRALAELLAADAAFIAVMDRDRPGVMRTLAMVVDGALRDDIEDYPIADTPCENVLADRYFAIADGACEAFPLDRTLVAAGVRSYAGHVLEHGRDAPYGIVAVAARRPMPATRLAESVIRIFAVRAAAELERNRAEAALLDSEASYRAIFEASEDCIFVHDWDTGRILDVSPAASRLYGYSQEELRELSVAAVSANVPPYTEREAQLLIQRAKVHAAPIRFEWHARHKSGELRWNEVTLKRATIAGEPRILAFVRDITERKKAEERLRASEEQHRTIFNASVDGMLLKDAEHRIVDVNDAFLRLLGYRRNELAGKSLLDFIAPELQVQCTALLPRIIAGEPCHVEARIHRRDGTPFAVEIHGVPMQYRGQPHALVIMRDITEAKRAEKRLRDSEERYRLLFETESDAILLVDVETLRLVDANPSAERLWGYGRDALLALTVSDLSAEPGETRDSIRLPTGRVQIPLRWHRRKDGTRFPVEITANRLMLDGRLTVVAAVRDITERKAAEEALRASEEQYRAIFNASADALVLRDAQFRIVDVNATYERMSGYTRAEVLGVQQVLANPPESHATLRELHDRALAGEPVQLETRLARRDGASRELELRALPVQHRGAPHVLWVGRDITERKRAEEALRTSEEQYRAVFNASQDAMNLWDEDLRMIDANPACLRLYGYSREDVIGRTFPDYLPRDYVAARRDLLRRAIAGERCQVETIGLRADGESFPMELRAVPLMYRGKPHALAIARDLTARKQAEAERVRLEAQLRQAQKMEAIGQLTGGIAHDFNNILTSVVGYVVLASERSGAREDPKVAHYLRQAEQSCRRARDLIQQMLTFSRGQRGERRRVGLAALVLEGAQLVRPMLPASIELRVDAEGEAAVEADPVQLEQVLLNLCINARDANGGRGEIRVAVRVWHDGECVCTSCRQRVSGSYVELAVSDDGPGIASEVSDRMFEPFFSTKEVGKGSGMGLAVVHGIVHEHGGHVCVDSVPGRGATFRALLPMLEGACAGGPDPRDAAAAAAPAALRGRVLLVDDEQAVLGFMRELLETWGLEVTACMSAADALETVARGAADFDVVITDQTMPRMTGLQLAAELAQWRPGLPVVLYTGYAEGLPEGGVAQARARAVLRKPIEPAELRNAIVPFLRGA
jgi:PAS domain S-box-containing protein